MGKIIDKLLFNPTRLKIVSALISLEECDFSYLKKITETTQGNLSVQLKKLNQEDYIKIKKTFQNNYPKTKCIITAKGKKSFESFFAKIQSYKNLDLVLILSFFGNYIFTNNLYLKQVFLTGYLFNVQDNFSVAFNGLCFLNRLFTTILEACPLLY